MSFLSLVVAAAFFALAHPAEGSGVQAPVEISRIEIPDTSPSLPATKPVPFYSQFQDIHLTKWQKVGCGIASLAMILEYHRPGSVASVDTLLEEGIARGAYLSDAGWTYAGLIGVAGEHGLSGESHDIAGTSDDAALAALEQALAKGPVIASVHYTFDPKNPIPHLVVVTGLEGDTVHYNDPAEPAGGGSISTATFLKAWKKRYIEIYPVSGTG